MLKQEDMGKRDSYRRRQVETLAPINPNALRGGASMIIYGRLFA